MGERCTFKDDDDCSFSFSYKENPGKDVTISVQREKGTHYITLCYVTLRCVALRYVALHYITLHYILTLLSFQSALFPVRDIFCCIRCTLKYSILLNPKSTVYFPSKLRFVLTILWGFSCDCRLLFWFNLFFFSQFVLRKQKHSL